jgi:NADH-quinone oxidoreductase subunit N
MKWLIAAPEIFYLFGSLCFLAWSLAAGRSGDAEGGREKRAAIGLAALGAAVCLASVWSDGHLFIKAFRADLFTQVFKVLLSAGLLLVTFICGDAPDVREGSRRDFYALLFLCTLAMMLLVSADHLLALYVSLELSSYSLYILVALRREERFGIEAGLKYFFIGSFASAIMLFGFALIYSGTQTIYLSEFAPKLLELIANPVIILGLVLALGGLFFKLAIFPFHFWAADAYQGAANPVAAYIATASKVAAIAVLLRMVSSVGQGSAYIRDVLAALAIISMTVGNLAAIAQRDVKRMLAFSTVAHSGYVLLGVVAMGPAGYASAIFYAVALLVMKFTVFLVVAETAPDGRNVQIKDLAALHRRSPILALALLVSLFSLAGVPPTIGFTGKFLIFIAAVDKGMLPLVLIAMINVVISLYYYLLVIRAAYLLEPATPLPPVQTSSFIKGLAGSLVAVIVIAGFYPNGLIELAETAARVLLRN